MADRDRYGERTRVPCTDPRCGNGCPEGWIGFDKAGRPRPCLKCKDHLVKGTVHDNDFAESTPSARAQAAIDAQNRTDAKDS